MATVDATGMMLYRPHDLACHCLCMMTKSGLSGLSYNFHIGVGSCVARSQNWAISGPQCAERVTGRFPRLTLNVVLNYLCVSVYI